METEDHLDDDRGNEDEVLLQPDGNRSEPNQKRSALDWLSEANKHDQDDHNANRRVVRSKTVNQEYDDAMDEFFGEGVPDSWNSEGRSDKGDEENMEEHEEHGGTWGCMEEQAEHGGA